MKPATVTIVTPSFNQGQYLDAAIRSITSQSYQHKELIVIDGGSTDMTSDVLRQNSKDIGYWVIEPDRGQSHAFNKGLSRARGDIIGWLNSDDLYLGNCIADAVLYFYQHDDIDIVFSDYIFIDAQSRFIRRRKETPFSLPIYIWTGKCPHANCAAFFRRRVFEKVGPLDESLQYGMDHEFYLRAASAGCKIGHVRAYWGAYRLHDMSKSVQSPSLQRQDSEAIVRRYRPASIGSVRTALYRCFWASVRIGGKMFSGSYLPAPGHVRKLYGE